MRSIKPHVEVIQPGYAQWLPDQKAQRADGTISHISSDQEIIVDTGLPKDKEEIINYLSEHDLSAEDIDYVICTHGDADHTSNNNLFPNAKLVVGFDIYEDDVATFFQTSFKIAEGVLVTEMTGHDDRSIGVQVQTEDGLVVVTGDLFEYENDWKTADNWIAFSKRPREQLKNRAKVWELADYIVPGHGPMFKVDKSVNILKIETERLEGFLKGVNVYGDVEL